jgi:hypothetical protein
MFREQILKENVAPGKNFKGKKTILKKNGVPGINFKGKTTF